MPICSILKLTVAENDGKLVIVAIVKRTKRDFTTEAYEDEIGFLPAAIYFYNNVKDG